MQKKKENLPTSGTNLGGENGTYTQRGKIY